MKPINLNLPEKDFFTFDEVAQRWGVDVSEVSHYVWVKHLLRPAFYRAQMQTEMGFRLYKWNGDGTPLLEIKIPHECIYIDFYNKNGMKYNGDFIYIDTKSNPFIDNFSSDAKDFPLMNDKQFKNFKNNSPWAWICLLPINQTKCASAKTLSGDIFIDFYGNPLSADVTSTSYITGSDYGNLLEKIQEIGVNGIEVSNHYIITKEERDRFESEQTSQQVTDKRLATQNREIVSMKIPEIKDRWFHCINTCIQDFENKNDFTPNREEIWNSLKNDPPQNCSVTTGKENRGTKVCLILDGVDKLTVAGLRERYRRYYPSRKD